MGAKQTITNVHRCTDSTTHNEIYPSQSFHLDETVTVGKVISSSLISGGPYVKRAAFRFDDYEYLDSDHQYWFHAYAANASEITPDLQLNINVNSSSHASDRWTTGRGRRDSSPPVNEGSTYAFGNVANDEKWKFPIGVGDCVMKYNISSSSHLDVLENISQLLRDADSGDNTFNFVGLEYNSLYQDDSYPRGEIEYYSSKTQTIYQPTILIASASETVWVASKEEGDFNVFTQPYVIYHKNLQPVYNYESTKIRFDIGVSSLYQTKTYGTSSQNPTIEFLPSASTYNFLDVAANHLVFQPGFESSNNFEADDDGMFISDVPTSLFYPGRLYRLVIYAGARKTGEVQNILPETFKIEKHT